MYDPTLAIEAFWYWFKWTAVLAIVLMLIAIAIDLWRDK